ncbi:SDR family NAD(P)-dependent oxidoreductase [Bacillus cereus group sp. N21]|uniref:SDR family NAD(P)-dependent oxidoreductase n=1 Tax=Bacillus cereus group sp. N21 TaxID=2794591 RepID=UPI0018F420D3|nr:glucose 1-dehydrogenase [Bacillus cereus group sp. N21]MBJ8030414.1 glucose 1-dehydrogenase [Bacillus cereus group sp. N21]
MRGIAGKVVIVTGGAQGIGRATVDRLVMEGAKVVIADNHMEIGRQVESELNKEGIVTYFVETDISDELSIENMVSDTIEKFGRIDMLVNCAATFIMRGIEATVEEWRRIMDVNIMGQAICVKHVSSKMIEVGKGSIVNIASISGHIAQSKYLTYNATKAAVANMTRCMAMDLAENNIRVNAVNPGTVWNKNNERYHLEELGLNREQANQHPEIGGMHMLKRTADPEEIASAIVFLLSDEASFITGENLMVDGGYTAM